MINNEFDDMLKGVEKGDMKDNGNKNDELNVEEELNVHDESDGKEVDDKGEGDEIDEEDLEAKKQAAAALMCSIQNKDDCMMCGA